MTDVTAQPREPLSPQEFRHIDALSGGTVGHSNIADPKRRTIRYPRLSPEMGPNDRTQRRAVGIVAAKGARIVAATCGRSGDRSRRTLPRSGAVLQPYGVSRRWLVVKRRSARSGRSMLVAFHSGLALDVLLEHRERSAAATNDAIRATPKYRLAIDAAHLRCELLADQARRDGFEIIDEH